MFYIGTLCIYYLGNTDVVSAQMIKVHCMLSPLHSVLLVFPLWLFVYLFWFNTLCSNYAVCVYKWVTLQLSMWPVQLCKLIHEWIKKRAHKLDDKKTKIFGQGIGIADLF